MDAPAESHEQPSAAPFLPAAFGIGRLFWEGREAVIACEASSGRIVLWNPAAAALFGYAEAEALRLTVDALVAPSHLPAHRAGLARFAATGQGAIVQSGQPVELPARHRSGAGLVVELSLYAVQDAPARGRFALALIRDVTARRAAEEALLRASDERFQALFAHAPFSVQLLSPDGVTVRVNRAWEELWGITLDQLAGYNMLHDEQLVAKGIMPYIRRAFAGEAVAIPAVKYEPAATLGAIDAVPYRWVEAFAYPVKDDAGRVREVVLMHTDTTARMEAEAARGQLLASEQAARRAAEEANRAKDEFLSVLSHELRTPLTPILGYVSVLRHRAPNPATLAHALGAIERSATAQLRLVGDLLDVSRIVTGKLELERRLTDLLLVLEAALDTIRPEAETKGVALTATLGSGVGLIMGDADRLQQVLGNLLTNAVRFTPAGGRVEVQLARDGDDARITVTDTGAGIAADFLPYVFDRFRQGDASSTRVHGGLGLGLAIVRHLVERHDGRVTATSEGPGRGAAFTVWLPLAAPAGRAGTVPAPGAGAAGALTGVRVLVVEDEADTRAMLQLILEDAGAKVATAASGDEALALLDTQGADVLLVDIGLPGDDGYAFLARVRARPREEGGVVPAVALTAFAGPEDQRRTHSAGFVRHLTKPVNPAVLTAVLAEITSDG